MCPVQLPALGMSGGMGRGVPMCRTKAAGVPHPNLQAGQAPQLWVARAGMGASTPAPTMALGLDPASRASGARSRTRQLP